MLTTYPACFFEEDTGYSVIFPDLNHLSTCGNTLDDAIGMAIDCLAGYLFIQKNDNETIPAPSSISDISIDDVANETYDSVNDYKNAFVNMVAVDVESYAREHFSKSVRKTLTIPAWLNSAALEKNINFSQTLQEALLDKVQSK